MMTERIDSLIVEKYGIDGAKAFSDLRLRSLSVDRYKKTATYTVSSPTEFSQEQKNELLKILKEVSVKDFKVVLDMTTDKMDCDIAKRLLWDFLKESCPSVYLALCDSGDSILFSESDGRISVTFKVTKKVKELLTSGALNRIKGYFASFTSIPFDFFISETEGDAADVKQTFDRLNALRERTVEAYASQPVRRVALEEKRDIIGKVRSDCLPKYIIDVLPTEQYVLICGKVGDITKRESKDNTMTICKFALTDFSGTINVTLFARDEKTLNAFCSIYEGDEIVVNGRPNVNAYSNNKLEVVASSIARCRIAKQTPQLDEFKPVPPEYAVISPMPFESSIQTNAFSEENRMNSVLKGRSFVVFDLETTGTQCQLDKITEIGAVKILNGKIIESFNTLINPQVSIPKEVVELTKITDDMVKDKPIFAEVCGDFYKFCHDCTIVGHNISFDYGFIDYYARPCGYLFNNPQIDTLSLARKYFQDKQSKNKPKDNKLETLARFFNLESGDFHRAAYDSLMTAMLFMKFIELDGTLLEKNGEKRL